MVTSSGMTVIATDQPVLPSRMRALTVTPRIPLDASRIAARSSTPVGRGPRSAGRWSARRRDVPDNLSSCHGNRERGLSGRSALTRGQRSRSARRATSSAGARGSDYGGDCFSMMRGSAGPQRRMVDKVVPVGPSLRYLRHFFDTVSNRSSCRPIAFALPRNRCPPV